MNCSRLNFNADNHEKFIFRGVCLVLKIFISLMLFTSTVLANPTGGEVQSGSATITAPAANTVLINQSSNQAIINWQSFNIGAQEKTQFVQPSSSAVTLNRINPGQGASQIFGHLSSNGQIILINQAGIFFGSGAQVNVGGIIASTKDITNQNFLNGKYIFDQPSAYAGSVINQGTIIATKNGLVALLGTSVSNQGLIVANLGSVVLASGGQFTVTFAGNEMISFTIDSEAMSSGVDQNGNPLKNGVSNSGKIIANGGNILMSAKSASNVLDNVINMSGVAQAHSVSNVNGEIILSANGDIVVSGKLDVSGHNGGVIKISGNNVYLSSTSLLSANGSASNGAGNGGSITVWSADFTNFLGKITATGGKTSGIGGFAEVSSADLLNFQGTVDLSAAKGNTGTLLLDPENLTIQLVGPTTATASGNTYTSNNDNSILTVADLEAALANANVLVQTGSNGTEVGDITVADSVTWNNLNTLTLSAFHNINVNASIINSAGGSLTLRADNTGTGVGTIAFAGVAPQIVMSGGGVVNFYYNPTSFPVATGYTSNVSVNSGTVFTAYMLIFSSAELQAINGNLAGDYALAKNITLTGNFTPLGSSAAPFTGKFDGLNNAISSLSITNTTPNTDLGLFGAANGATIANVTLDNVSITQTADNSGVSIYIGSLVGLMNGGSLSNDNVVNPVISASGTNFGISGSRGYYDIGGLVGAVFGGTFTNSYSSGGGITNNVNTNPGAGMIAFNEVGGLIGGVHSSSALQNVYSSTAVTSNGNVTVSNATGELLVGGLIGRLDTTSTANNAHSSGAVTVTSTLSVPSSSGAGYVLVGGLIGVTSLANSNFTPVINNAYSSSSVTLNATLTNSTNAGIAEFLLGGLLGQSNGVLANSYSSGAVVGTYTTDDAISATSNNFFYAGGLAGDNFTIITNSYSSSPVMISGVNNGAEVNVGGLVGAHTTLYDKEITNSFSAGAVEVAMNTMVGGQLYVGGLIGSIIYYGSAAMTWPFSNNYSTSAVNVSGANNASLVDVGGLIGANGQDVNDPGGNIVNSFSQGIVHAAVNTTNGGTTNLGGFIGSNIGSSATLTNNFWDTDTSGYNQNQGVGSNPGVFAGLTPGCFTGVCVNGGTANLSSEATYTSAGWNFVSTWRIIQGQSYPYLLGVYATTPQAFSGTNQAVTDNGMTLVENGGVIGMATTGANGFFYFLQPGGIAATTPLLAYYSGGAVVGNALFMVPSAGASITGLDIAADTITVGSEGTSSFSNSDLATVIGSLSNSNILYSISGANNIAVNNNVSFNTTPTTTYTLNGNLAGPAGGANTIIFNGPVIVGSSSTLVATSISFENTLSGSQNLTVNGQSNNNFLAINTGSFENWLLTGANQGSVMFPALTGTFVFSNIQNLTGGNNGNTFAFENGASIAGAINGGSDLSQNTLDYSLYSTALNTTFLAQPDSGYTQNTLGNFIDQFTNISMIILANTTAQLPVPLPIPDTSITSIALVKTLIVNAITPFNTSSYNTSNGNELPTPLITMNSALTNVITKNMIIEGLSLNSVLASLPEKTPVNIYSSALAQNLPQQVMVNPESQTRFLLMSNKLVDDTSQEGFLMALFLLALIATGGAVALNNKIIHENLPSDPLEELALSLSAANEINVINSSFRTIDEITISNTKDVIRLLKKGLPEGFNITPFPVSSGSTVSGVITEVASRKIAIFEVTGV